MLNTRRLQLSVNQQASSWSSLVVIGSIKTCCEGKGARKKKRFLNIDKDRRLTKLLKTGRGRSSADVVELLATRQLLNPQTVLMTIRNHAEPPDPERKDDNNKEPWSVPVCLISGDGLEQKGFESLIKSGKYKECYKALNFIAKGGKPSLWTKDDVQARLKENIGTPVVWRSAKAKAKPSTTIKTEL